MKNLINTNCKNSKKIENRSFVNYVAKFWRNRKEIFSPVLKRYLILKYLNIGDPKYFRKNTKNDFCST